jgi:DNA-binding NtrC family response regulator
MLNDLPETRSAALPSDGDEGLPLILRGQSAAAVRQREEFRAAAGAAAAVLIAAERGVDPLEVARSLHRSERGRLIVISCNAAPEQLHEILFGGPEADNGRTRQLEVVRRRSAFVEAGDGTLILADIQELPAALQRRLARVLRDGEIYVQESRQAVRVDARIVATTRPDLDDDVRAGRFRDDLYRRLSSHRIALAPLRERAEDIPDLVHVLAEEIAAAHGSPARSYTPAALTALASLPWQRNLDELRELLTRLHAIAPGAPARQEDVIRHVGFGGASPVVQRFDNLREARKRFEREYIGVVLDQHRWRMAEAAATLGIERANLYRKIRQLGLTKPTGGAS